MRRYLIVHRAGEIYKLVFTQEHPDVWVYTPFNGAGIFYPVVGWHEYNLKGWLDQRGFEYYWEDDQDD